MTTTLALAAALVLGTAGSSLAVTVVGGGSKTATCMSVFEADANKPAPPKTPKQIDCVDGDPTCDTDGLENAQCVFSVQVCVNHTMLAGCVPEETDSVVVDHAIDDGDPKFDPDFQAIQTRVDLLGFPGNDNLDDCAQSSSITVRLKSKSGSKFKKNKKKLVVRAEGTVTGKDTTDKDNLKVTCRPRGDGIYLPTDLYAGTFDRIVQQIFVSSCALSACHDSETEAGGLNLLAGAAYSQIHNVVPANGVAAGAGLLRIDPGDPDLSFLYRKIVPDLEAGWGDSMPLGLPLIDADLVEIVRLWIIGDMTLGEAPEFGWVEGTDQ